MLDGVFHGNILCVENGRLIHKNDTLLPGLVHRTESLIPDDICPVPNRQRNEENFLNVNVIRELATNAANKRYGTVYGAYMRIQFEIDNTWIWMIACSNDTVYFICL